MGQQIYNTSGSGNWTVPGLVTSVTVTCVGAGATGNGSAGGGGGGGAYAQTTSYSVTPGASIPYVVGDGTSSLFGHRDTSFNSGAILAAGGSIGTTGSGGAGGLATDSTGSTKHDGGTGGNATFGNGGGGGGASANAAGAGANGTNGVSSSVAGTGGAGSGIGGSGGNGGASGHNNGFPGTSPGGGGGGAFTVMGTGGNGADGYIQIDWTTASPPCGSTRATKQIDTESRIMQKNVASQLITVQMTTATDGSDFSGTVTVYVTGDNGTQTIGGTSSGVCVSKGRGLYTYIPTQAETNYNVIDFTFAGTGAITISREVSTSCDANLISLLGNPTAAAGLADACSAIIRGVASGTPTTTNIPTSSLSPAAAVTDQFKGQVLVFNAGTSTTNLRGQRTTISGSSSGGILTVDVLTTAPVSGDTFTIE